MLKRYFIPLILVLTAVAAVVYFYGGRTTRTRDMRILVPVERFSLSNGLTVVVMPNHRIPIVTHLLVVKAGSADDPQGKSGLAHYLEHLLFTGTENFPEGAYDRAIARVGGAQNAFTTRDYTLYYATVDKKHLARVMTMEADRLAHLAFDAPRAARELKIITEERAMRVDTNPAAQWQEQLDALTFLNHPYRRPVIGWAEDMASFTAEDARGFFAANYRPGNMVLLVAGDTTAREVRRLAQRYYGGLPAGDVAARNWPNDPPARLTRRGDMRDARVNEPRLLRQYAAPGVRVGATGQALPLSVFAHYLGGGDASVLYSALVREQKLASSVRVDYDPLRLGPGLFRIHAIPASGVSLPQLEAALDRTLAQVLATPPDTAAIARAKTLLTAEITFAQDGLESLANVMAGLYAIGLDEQFFYDWAGNVAAVDDAAVLAAARALITPDGGVTGTLSPAPAPPLMEAADAP